MFVLASSMPSTKVRLWASLAVVMLATLVLVACASRPSFADPRLQVFDDDLTTAGQAHLADGQVFTYPSLPPYAGPMSGNVLPCRVYEDQQPFEPIVHAMEHGAVVLYFQPDVFSGDEAAALRLLGTDLLRRGDRFILMPNRQLRSPLVLASWGRLLELPRAEESTIEAFVDAFENDGPERIQRAAAC